MIFPTLRGKRASDIHLNYLSRLWMENEYRGSKVSNPLLNPYMCDQMVNHIHTVLAVDWSYGGYLEDRSGIWAESYLAENGFFLHLGVDFNAPAGTPVSIDVTGVVIRIDNDTPLVGGWGTRVIVKVQDEDIILIYAHLDCTPNCKVGDTLKPGDVFAWVGAPDCNGYWYPHVHVQAMSTETYQEFKDRPDELDGYGDVNDILALRKRFPNPCLYVQVK